MKEIWSWENTNELKHAPKWAVTLLELIGLPIVIVATIVIVLPSLYTKTNILIVVGIVMVTMYLVKNSFSTNGMRNKQILIIYRDKLYLKIDQMEKVYLFNNIDLGTFQIIRMSIPKKLEFKVKETGKVIRIPLIGMSANNINDLWSVLKRVA